MKMTGITSLLLLVFCYNHNVKANTIYTIQDSLVSYNTKPNIVLLENDRSKREVSVPIPAAGLSELQTSPATASVAPSISNNAVQKNSSEALNTTTNLTTKTTNPPLATVTVTPRLLGVNGSGILRVNLTENTPKVSEPIVPDDNITDVFRETPERIKAEHNLKNLTYDNHLFYNTSFIGNITYFNELWANISGPNAEVHDVLSNSHRRATTLNLKFEFPFYGHGITNITVATGGFIYTGEHVHHWLAATQYIAPLMANFDTTLTKDSVVKYYDDGEKFTVIWENVTLQEAPTKKFTFAVTLHKNGDIIFAYKNIPIAVQQINDTIHPVKVGVSDAYLKDKYIFNLRQKTIYEYHRVSFTNHEITNSTILKLTALPTCIQYTTCESCANHETNFQCFWCEHIQKCSSGTDRNKQDWIVRNCEKYRITNASACPSQTHVEGPSEKNNTAYRTDSQNHMNPSSTVVVSTVNTEADEKTNTGIGATSSSLYNNAITRTQEARSPIGGVVAAFIVITLICTVAAWVLYAFKNPHTRSGQFLIKYRPSQWGWRRGEARYTAATIHM